MSNVLTEQVLRRAAERLRSPQQNERRVFWATGRVCFIAPIDAIIGLVAAGFVEFENREFYVTIRAEHELRLRGLAPENDGPVSLI